MRLSAGDTYSRLADPPVRSSILAFHNSRSELFVSKETRPANLRSLLTHTRAISPKSLPFAETLVTKLLDEPRKIEEKEREIER